MKRLTLQNHRHQVGMLTRKELEAALQVTPMTVYLWRKMEDPIPCRIVSTGARHRIYFPIALVQAWLAKHRPHLATKIGGLNGSGTNHGVGSRGIDAERAEGVAA